jgi:hypothetical protein
MDVGSELPHCPPHDVAPRSPFSRKPSRETKGVDDGDKQDVASGVVVEGDGSE